MKSEKAKEYIALKVQQGYLDERQENIAIKACNIAEGEMRERAIEAIKISCEFRGNGEEIDDIGHCWAKNGENCSQQCNGLDADSNTCAAIKHFIQQLYKQE